jgi:hypothetical protein
MPERSADSVVRVKTEERKTVSFIGSLRAILAVIESASVNNVTVWSLMRSTGVMHKRTH